MSQAAPAAPAAQASSTSPGPWYGRLVRWARGHRERVPFTDVVWAHYRRTQALMRGVDDPVAEEAYRGTLARFEACEGPITSAYWCVHLPSGLALTARPPRRPVRWLDWIGWPRRLAFHRASDWSTQPAPRAAALIHRCDALAVRVGEVLIGTGHQVAMGLVGRSAGNLLSLVDTPSAPADPAELDAALEREEKRLADTEAYYRETAIRQTQLVYIGGMLIGVAALVAVAVGLLQLLDTLTGISWGLRDGVSLSLSELLGVAAAGALGAIVSVVRRVDSDSFSLDYEVGRLCLVGLGMLRPFMGAVFGLALYAAVISGFLDVFAVPQDATPQLFFLLAIAFLAGFSERFAEDTLLSGESRTKP